MKVLLVNGSPNEKGCTYTALMEVADTLEKEGIEKDIFWIGNKPLSGCIDCKTCMKKKKCVFDDRVNEFLEIAASVDGFIFGSPVHFGSAGGAITSFMDRAFFADMVADRQSFYLKPAAAIVSARRAGTTAALDQLNRYFSISAEMPIISSRYWNLVHGSTPEEVKKDLEGMQTMRVLARNMAWFLKCKEAGIKAGVRFPVREEDIFNDSDGSSQTPHEWMNRTE
ncbi:flavodoxin family protein [Clostridium beijerinckii]|uniref:flavodoxin family protein n=1 Tax=Clostridium beijerinckii TaxID=1520 RepID=UPI00098C9418|nr:flavodoxin family protein [Clostridium beijerinckii]MBA8936008.1 multimeric flavodoxin WrbA [Clostridium beijerinckii]NRU36081.1 multimeric flavodoxin WrbA [Clostridium beijerinckii]NSB00639.1 multimeric flavodoxin WrbA [Clostridium beijerinckii]OOM64779.1 iron-sulfur flavoprotein [Clostridium beijerinckii]OOM73301.1 iron-sulfur flavoprotein [Clostridium beijerinckii]